jgi:DNA-binding response OmpR family regulator
MSEQDGGFILLVDDDDAFASDLLAVWRAPRRVRRVDSTEAARRLLAHEAPLLVILDLCLPGFGAGVNADVGFDLLRYIRSLTGHHVPVVVLTGDISPDTSREVVSSRADMLLHKPVVVDVLDAAVRRLLRCPRPLRAPE